MLVVLRPIPTKMEGAEYGSLFENKILLKSPKPRNKAQRKVDYKNVHVLIYSYQEDREEQKIFTSNSL